MKRMTVTLVGETYNVLLKQHKYADGEPKLVLVDEEDGCVVTVVSVSLPLKPDEGCIWIKDWSENEGITDQLVAAGVVELTGMWVQTGFVTVHEGRLLP